MSVVRDVNKWGNGKEWEKVNKSKRAALSAAIKGGGRRRGEAGRAAGEWGGVGYIHGEEDWGGGCVIR